MLTEAQRKQIESFNGTVGTVGSLHIYMTAYFESKVGRFFVQKSIERQKL